MKLLNFGVKRSTGVNGVRRYKVTLDDQTFLLCSQNMLCSMCPADCIDRTSKTRNISNLGYETLHESHAGKIKSFEMWIYNHTGEGIISWCPFGGSDGDLAPRSPDTRVLGADGDV